MPRDISIVGAGDIAYGDMLMVPLTTVRWSRSELGTRAAQLILDQMEQHPAGPYERVIIPPHLVERESCGPPSKRPPRRKR